MLSKVDVISVISRDERRVLCIGGEGRSTAVFVRMILVCATAASNYGAIRSRRPTLNRNRYCQLAISALMVLGPSISMVQRALSPSSPRSAAWCVLRVLHER